MLPVLFIGVMDVGARSQAPSPHDPDRVIEIENAALNLYFTANDKKQSWTAQPWSGVEGRRPGRPTPSEEKLEGHAPTGAMTQFFNQPGGKSVRLKPTRAEMDEAGKLPPDDRRKYWEEVQKKRGIGGPAAVKANEFLSVNV